jgi:predicted ABC-type transport system involved in lysophospholipase L1 biosynthesis ATPase subunit
MRGVTAVIATHNLALANRMPRRFKLAEGMIKE